MRKAIALVALLAGTSGCGLVSWVTGGTQVRTAPLVRTPLDRELLAYRLTLAQPAWPGRLPILPARPRDIDCSTTKCVALTFDDGPYDYTGTVLDDLAAHHARATFFVLGQMVDGEKREASLRRMIAEGHEIGNHTWDHKALNALSPEQIRAELDKTSAAIERATGISRISLMRPPYGLVNAKVTAEARRRGFAQVLWAVDTFDWRDRNSGLVFKRAAAAPPGAIVLMHDIHKTTVDALPKILDALDRKGYTYVTVSELIGPDRITPGDEYQRR